MKTLPLALIAAAIVLASCSSTQQTASTEYDDVYYNPNKAEKQAAATVYAAEPVVTPQQAMNAQPLYQEPSYSAPVAVADEILSDYEVYRLQQEAEMLGETYAPQGSEALYSEQYVEYDTLGEYGLKGAPVIINNNYYTDPTDYYYSSNLRRFSDNYNGWNYYDPYYTDMYWYTGSPYSWGISMGFGYPGWGMSFSYGNPYRPYYGYGGYYGGYYPYYGYGGYYGGYPYYGGSYWSGYNHGYYHGYNNGYYGNDYYGGANYRYGKMDSRQSYGYSRSANVSSGSSKASTAGDPRYRSRTTASAKSATARSTTSGATAAQRQGTNGYGTAAQRQVRTNTNSAAQRTQTGAVKTTRTAPSANVQQRSSNSTTPRGTYTPSYSKPRTSSTSGYNKSATPNRSYSQPATQNRSTTVNRAATTPTRTGTSYSRPSSSTRSSSSYSRPSSSSGSRSSGSVSQSSGRSSSSGSVSRSSGGGSSVSRSSGGSSSGSSSSGGGRSSGGSSSGGSSRR